MREHASRSSDAPNTVLNKKHNTILINHYSNTQNTNQIKQYSNTVLTKPKHNFNQTPSKHSRNTTKTLVKHSTFTIKILKALHALSKSRAIQNYTDSVRTIQEANLVLPICIGLRYFQMQLQLGGGRAYILKASDVAVMAILAKKNWRKICP